MPAGPEPRPPVPKLAGRSISIRLNKHNFLQYRCKAARAEERRLLAAALASLPEAVAHLDHFSISDISLDRKWFYLGFSSVRTPDLVILLSRNW
jgi:hypothetical protein